MSSHEREEWRLVDELVRGRVAHKVTRSHPLLCVVMISCCRAERRVMT